MTIELLTKLYFSRCLYLDYGLQIYSFPNFPKQIDGWIVMGFYFKISLFFNDKSVLLLERAF